MAKEFSYSKIEKLKSRKLTEQLFSSGKTFTIFPLKIFYMPVTGTDFPVKAGVAVSSRHFRKATDRTRIKRLLREAYRVEKKILIEHAKANEQNFALFFLYIDKTMPEASSIKSKMKIVIERLIKQLHEKTAANT